MKKILIAFGTRPEAIKMAPLILALRKIPQFDVKVLVTAQHRSMLDQVLSFFGITPDFDLDIMRPSQDLFDVTSNILLGLRDVFDSYRPDLVCVHGDTTTTLATSLAAFYQKIDVAHVEAGLRTFKKYSPFPEEMNRQLTTSLAKFHFAPTAESRENLLRERILPENVLVSGNTVIDALNLSLERIKGSERGRLAGLPYVPSDRRFVLITGHRRENFGDGFVQICDAIRDLSGKYADVDFVYPVHLNPNVQTPVDAKLQGISNVKLIEPLDYPSFVHLMAKCYLILTDSGGVQEEAPSLGKPVLVMRETTERPEAVTAGTVKLVGASKTRIIGEVSKLIDSREEYDKMSRAHNPYGDGKASERIVRFLQEKFAEVSDGN